MENASKALLIAGAILIVILIITLGMAVYNNATSSVNQANLSEQEIQAWNSRFTSYQGDHVSGANVNSLIQTAISVNQSAINEGGGNYVKVKSSGLGTGKELNIEVGTDGTMDLSSTKTALKVDTGKIYKVKLTYNNALVSQIDVSLAGAEETE